MVVQGGGNPLHAHERDRIRGMVVAMRMLPSLETRLISPVSAQARLQPVSPMSALSIFSPQGHAGRPGQGRKDLPCRRCRAFPRRGRPICLPVHVDAGGDDVRGGVAGQLDDVFAEIGLGHLDAGGSEGLVDIDFIGKHRLALDDPTDVFFLATSRT